MVRRLGVANKEVSTKFQVQSYQSLTKPNPDFIDSRAQSLLAEVDAERTVIEARLQQPARPIDDAFARSR